MLFHTESTDLVSRLIEGHYPDIERIIPSNQATRTVLETQELAKAVKLASFFANASSNIVRLTFGSGDELSLSKLRMAQLICSTVLCRALLGAEASVDFITARKAYGTIRSSIAKRHPNALAGKGGASIAESIRTPGGCVCFADCSVPAGRGSVNCRNIVCAVISPLRITHHAVGRQTTRSWERGDRDAQSTPAARQTRS